jgi:cyclopropane fatty-acyl-phospholipid synthase-like methyltransferase
MKDWKKFWGDFWNAYPARAGADEYFKQVGKTVNGAPISPAQFDALMNDITRLLALQSDDIVLDLCCGNGLITREIASKCQQVVGVDFSEILIQRAKENATSPNVKYIQMDVRQIRKLSTEYPGYFTKVLWYEALAFFDTKDLVEILDVLTIMTRKNAVILIGSVLDAERKWNFFNTFRRRFMYIVNIVLLGKEVGLGKWWPRKEISDVCRKAGYEHEFHYQSKILHTAHYRIDVKLTRPAGS